MESIQQMLIAQPIGFLQPFQECLSSTLFSLSAVEVRQVAGDGIKQHLTVFRVVGDALDYLETMLVETKRLRQRLKGVIARS